MAAFIRFDDAYEIILAAPHPDGILQVIRSFIQVLRRSHPGYEAAHFEHVPERIHILFSKYIYCL